MYVYVYGKYVKLANVTLYYLTKYIYVHVTILCMHVYYAILINMHIKK